MTYKEALDYIDGVRWYGSKPGLERVSALLEKLGDPQRGFLPRPISSASTSACSWVAGPLRTMSWRSW